MDCLRLGDTHILVMNDTGSESNLPTFENAKRVD